jgi:Tol biopolymer transport system component
MGSHLHAPPVFTSDGTEVYWGAYDDAGSRINTMKLVDGTWTAPEKLVVSPALAVTGDPSLSPDGDSLFFLARKPSLDAPVQQREFIWVAQREGDGWGAPSPLPQSINALTMHWTMATSLAGDLYFAAGPELIDDIYLSRKVDGEFTAPQKLEAPVNTPDFYDFAPHIAPDGSFLLFTRMDPNSNSPYLFITYALPDGLWSEPAQVKNVYYCIAPVLSPDSKYVFFLSDPDHFSWRDTSFIEELRP